MQYNRQRQIDTIEHTNSGLSIVNDYYIKLPGSSSTAMHRPGEAGNDITPEAGMLRYNYATHVLELNLEEPGTSNTQWLSLGLGNDIDDPQGDFLHRSGDVVYGDIKLANNTGGYVDASGLSVIASAQGSAFNDPNLTSGDGHSRLLNSDGTVANPSYTFDSDRTTGFSRTADGEIKYSAQGVEVLTLNDSGLVLSGQAKFSDGTVSEPGIAFEADQDTGLYRPGDNTIGIVVGGTEKITVNETDITVTDQVFLIDGTETEPGIAFAQDTNSGIYRITDDEIGIVVNGLEALRIAYAGAGATREDTVITVQGDLVVEGETTTVNTTNLNIEDNVITLNANETGSGVTLGTAGIEVNRGLLDNAGWFYDETNNWWGPTGAAGSILPGVGATETVGNISTIDTTTTADNLLYVESNGARLQTDGSTTNVSYGWGSDHDTGLYHPSLDQIEIVAGGVAQINVNTSNIQVNDNLLAIDGTSASPAYSFQTEASTGMYLNASTDLRFSINGVDRVLMQDDITTFNSTAAIVLPAGTTAERPSSPAQASIRYNQDTVSFEGFDGTVWRGLGGVIDTDQDTYIIAEDSPGSDNDQLKFFTAGVEHMRIESNGELEVYASDPILSIMGTEVTGVHNTELNFKDAGGTTLSRMYTSYIGGASHTYLDANNPSADLVIQTQGTDRLTVASTGQVGIGSATPTARLHVQDAIGADTNGGFKMETSAGGGIILYPEDTTADPSWLLQTYSSEDLKFAPGGTVRLMADASTGYIGINEQNPAAPLHITGTNPRLRISDTSATNTTDMVGFIEFYQGVSTAVTGRIGYTSEVNDTLYIYNDTVSGGSILLAPNGADTSAYLEVDTAGTLLPQADITQDIGSASLRWSTAYAETFNGVATEALYADLAERYSIISPASPGTVVVISESETEDVAVSREEYMSTVLGVVSTDPGIKMNSAAGTDETHPYIALTGRVPCRVVGRINKGDMLVTSSVAGHAQAISKARVASNPLLGMGTIIGKALESHKSEGTGVIEIAVLRG